MNKYSYKIKENDALNTWKRSRLQSKKINTAYDTIEAAVNMTEGYLEIEYPVRREFLKNSHNPIAGSEAEFPFLYHGFENPRVDFSTFITTPHQVSTYLKADLVAEQEQAYTFDLTTCGRVCIWVNGKLCADFHPYTRNHGTLTQIDLPLLKGTNELLIYMDDLAERDVNFFFELRLRTAAELVVALPTGYDSEQLDKSIQFLSGLYFDKDFYTEGEVTIGSDYDYQDQVYLKYEGLFFDEEGAGGNLTDFKRQDVCLPVVEKSIVLGKVGEIPASGLTAVHIGVPLPDGQLLYKKFAFSIYEEQQLFTDESTLAERKQLALEQFAALELLDMNSGLAELFLGHEMDASLLKKFEPAFQMIEEKGDCADFMFAPLLSYTLANQQTLPKRLTDKVKELALDFRYWIDEPGNDVMWYFSENHSLLFHTCQYFAGRLYEEEQFSVSGRKGTEQYCLGKKRLIDWFQSFQQYGFSEWNSSTYLPIDLIGFFSLYYAAPDQEIRDLAKEALDFTFKVIAVNQHSGVLSSTFGRTYEHDLKAMRLGEISNVLAIAWNRGCFNHGLRAAVMFCLSDYQPPENYLKYIDLPKGTYLLADYIQGISKVETYLYKTEEYSLASAVNYNAFKKGHQQHLMNLSLGKDGTQLWLNNPGEYMHSGENRPSYWAGNGICPRILQYRNTCFLNYRLQEAYVQKIHLYLPYWALTEIRAEHENWLFLRKDSSYLAVWFSEGYTLEKSGDTRNREIVSNGTEHTVVVKCASQAELGSFETFIAKMRNTKVEAGAYQDLQWGQMTWTDTLTVNGEEQMNKPTYEIEPVFLITGRKDGE